MVLKTSEGTAEFIVALMQREMAADPSWRSARDKVMSLLARLQGRIDYAEYGGAPLLGINGVSIIGHGRSHARAVASGIRAASGRRRQWLCRGDPRGASVDRLTTRGCAAPASWASAPSPRRRSSPTMIWPRAWTPPTSGSIRRTGIRARRIAAPDVATSDLALAAARNALADAGPDAVRPGPDHRRHRHAGLPRLVPVHGGGRAGGAGREAGRRVRPRRGLCRFFLRPARRRADGPGRGGTTRPGDRRGDVLPHPELGGPQHRRPVWRRRGRGGCRPGVRGRRTSAASWARTAAAGLC